MKKLAFLVLCNLLLLAPAAQAAPEQVETLYSKVGLLTMNLRELTQFLRVDISLKAANSAALNTIKIYSPVIKHELILLLTTKKVDQINTTAGKQKLMEEVREKINHALKLAPGEGVTEVFFQSFVIQPDAG